MNPINSEIKDSVLLSHILSECQKIVDLTSRISYADFLNDNTYQDALCRRIEIIGEAASNLSDEFVSSHSEIPVRDMKAMRNVLAHQYFRVDIEYVWLTVTNDIPPLYSKIKELLEY